MSTKSKKETEVQKLKRQLREAKKEAREHKGESGSQLTIAKKAVKLCLEEAREVVALEEKVAGLEAELQNNERWRGEFQSTIKQSTETIHSLRARLETAAEMFRVERYVAIGLGHDITYLKNALQSTLRTIQSLGSMADRGRKSTPEHPEEAVKELLNT